MTTTVAVLATVLLLTFGGADYWFVERPHATGADQSSSSTQNIESSSSSLGPVKKGVSKKGQVSVEDIFLQLGITPMDTTETTMLQTLAAQGGIIAQTKVLLQTNDRAALFGWAESPDVKTLYLGLKQALQQHFSPQVQGLTDQTLEPDTGPPYDMLSFTDPAISPEHIIFIRVRTRLYEIHVAPGKEDTINQLIAALTQS